MLACTAKSYLYGTGQRLKSTFRGRDIHAQVTGSRTRMRSATGVGKSFGLRVRGSRARALEMSLHAIGVVLMSVKAQSARGIPACRRNVRMAHVRCRLTPAWSRRRGTDGRGAAAQVAR